MEIEIKVDTGGAIRYLTDSANRIDRAIVRGVDDAAKLVRREMRVYPPKPPPAMGTAYNPVRFTTRAGRNVDFMGRRRKPYERTDTLRTSWFVGKMRRIPGGVTQQVFSSGNVAPYNVYVQKAGMQAAVHRGRWPTEVDVAQRLQPRIVTIIQSRVIQATSR